MKDFLIPFFLMVGYLVMLAVVPLAALVVCGVFFAALTVLAVWDAVSR